jgi:hypothetical protein
MHEFRTKSLSRGGHATAALIYGIPVVRVSAAADDPHFLRGRCRLPPNLALECMTVLCLCGPAAEQLFCGPIVDGGDECDLAMAREYLAREFDPLRVGIELMRLRDAADKLARTPWASRRIQVIATALLQRGSLTGEQIAALG